MNITPIQSNTNFRAVKLDPNAQPVIKRQVIKMSIDKNCKFWQKFDEIVQRQLENPVDIIVRQCNNRKNALAAEVVDHSEDAIGNLVFTQGILCKKGLKFLEQAEKKADIINDTNTKLTKYTPATDDDYFCGPVELDEE